MYVSMLECSLKSEIYFRIIHLIFKAMLELNPFELLSMYDSIIIFTVSISSKNSYITKHLENWCFLCPTKIQNNKHIII